MSNYSPPAMPSPSVKAENENSYSTTRNADAPQPQSATSSPTKSKWVPKKIATSRSTSDDEHTGDSAPLATAIVTPNVELNQNLSLSFPETKPASYKWKPSKLLTLPSLKPALLSDAQKAPVNSLYDDIKPITNSNMSIHHSGPSSFDSSVVNPYCAAIPTPPQSSSLPTSTTFKPTIQLNLKKPITIQMPILKPSSTFAPIEMKLPTPIKKVFVNPLKAAPKITILPPKMKSLTSTQTDVPPETKPPESNNHSLASSPGSSNTAKGGDHKLPREDDPHKKMEKNPKASKHRKERKTQKKTGKVEEKAATHRSNYAKRSRSKSPLAMNAPARDPPDNSKRNNDFEDHAASSLPAQSELPVSEDPKFFAARPSTTVRNTDLGLCYYPRECVKYTRTLPSLAYCPNNLSCKRLLEEALPKSKPEPSKNATPKSDKKHESQRKRGLDLPLSPLESTASVPKRSKQSRSSISPKPTLKAEAPPLLPVPLALTSKLDDVYADFLKSVQDSAKVRRSRSHSPGWSSDSQQRTPSPKPLPKEPSPLAIISPSKMVALKLPTKKLNRVSLPLFADDEEELEKDIQDKPTQQPTIKESTLEHSKITKEETPSKPRKDADETLKRDNKSSERNPRKNSSFRSRTPEVSPKRKQELKDSRSHSRKSGNDVYDATNRDPRRRHRPSPPRDHRDRGRTSEGSSRPGRESHRGKERDKSDFRRRSPRSRRSRSPAVAKPPSPRSPATIELKIHKLSPRRDWEEQQSPERPYVANRSWSSSDSEGSPPPSKLLKSQRQFLMDSRGPSPPNFGSPPSKTTTTSSSPDDEEKALAVAESSETAPEEKLEDQESGSPVRLSLDERLQLVLGVDQKEKEEVQPGNDARPPWQPRPGSMKLVQVGNSYQIVPSAGHVTERGPYGPGNLPVLRPGIMLPTVPIMPPVRYPIAPVQQPGFAAPLSDPRLVPAGMLPSTIPGLFPALSSPMFTTKTVLNEESPSIPGGPIMVTTPNPVAAQSSVVKKVEEVLGDLDEEDKILVMEAMSYVPKEEPTSPLPCSKREKRTHKPSQRISIRPPPEKGILVLPGSKIYENGEEGIEKRKSVVFADKIRPGDGTSPSGGEELTSPLPFVRPPKRKRLFKKRMFKKTKTVEEDTDFENMLPPPPPPGSPPPHARNLIYVEGIVYVISIPGHNLSGECHSSPKVPAPLAPLPSPLELQAELLPPPSFSAACNPAVNQTRAPISSPVYDSPPPGVSPPR